MQEWVESLARRFKSVTFFLKTVKYFSPQCWGDAAGVSGQHSTLGALNTTFSSSLLMALNKSLHLLVPVLPPWVLRLRNQDIWKGTVSDYSFIACSAHRCLGFQWVWTFYSSWTILFNWVIEVHSVFFPLSGWWSKCYHREKDLILDCTSTKRYLLIPDSVFPVGELILSGLEDCLHGLLYYQALSMIQANWVQQNQTNSLIFSHCLN